ncbi:helix-turn-helix domain-containing protein [Streptomyces sp. ND04-05B]|uniref:helix-turn-helix domain-containing protein n=1 Tax=Streptomyces sp. ND04-05B TaxID=3028693 RepID=UPI0029BE3315|nr:helix-turn-helix domain-containing protein [Streptomyces sp. ND04-05B]MDX3069345.1 helix-turn-helix domain-containing protein [Streptomyces sp. ND04-05B]
MTNQHTPVTDEDRAEIVRLHAQGLGRNEIARRTGRAQRTVSVICAEEGLVFDVTMTEDATRHRMAQLAEKRAILAEAYVDDALRLSEQVWQPTVVFNFGGKDNTYNDKVLPEPPAHDKKALMAASVAAAEQSRRLAPPADDAGAEAAKSVLGQLWAGLKSAYDQGREEGGEEAEGDSP